jgi:NAD(P)-dependent dehydrogenase (short-subunit alcohol dehydrogenase family)
MRAPAGRLAGKVALITGAGRGFVVLAAHEAGYLTGQIFHSSGGWVSG